MYIYKPFEISSVSSPSLPLYLSTLVTFCVSFKIWIYVDTTMYGINIYLIVGLKYHLQKSDLKKNFRSELTYDKDSL